LLRRRILFPEEFTNHQNTASPNRISHRALMTVGRGAEALAALRAQFNTLNESGFKTIILTNEYLANLPVAAIERLRDVIDAPDVRIVYACRRWSDRLPSMWFQHIFENGTRTLPHFYSALISQKEFGPEVDYAQIWDNWAGVFGRANLMLFPYSNLKDRGDDLFDRFCTDIFGIQPVPVGANAKPSHWASPKPVELELVRAMNAYRMRVNPQHAANRATAMFWGWVKLMNIRDFSRLYEIMAGAEETFVIDDEVRPLAALYDKLSPYQDLVAGGGPIFTPSRRETRFIAPDYLLLPEAAELIRAYSEEIMAA
jgi:hypothetical protein